MQHWKLSLAERVELLKLWILPLIVYPARVVFPTSPVISMLRTVYSVALRLNSWGVTTSILALPKTLGGLALAQPRTFLLWQHATPFVHSIRSPGSVSKLPYDDFKVFAHRHGIALQQEFLPFFQMGSNVVWNTMPYLAWSARAFSMVKQGVSVPDVAGLSYDTPLWNSCLFRNTQQLTYFCPSLIKFGITTVGALLEDESSYELIAPSWRPVYRDTIRRLASPSLVAAGVPECPPLYLWYQWTSVKMVNYLGLAGAEPPRQTEEVWKAFFSSDFPAPHRDTIYQALWKKLPVGERLRSWLPGEVNCPLDGACESVLHAVTACKFLPVAYNTVDKCFPADGPGESVSASTVIHTHPVQSLTSPHGILAWSAFIASWAARCVAKHDASEVVSWSGFLTLWIAVTQLWSAATKLAISGAQLVIFSGALIALRDEGKLSHPTLDASPPLPQPHRARHGPPGGLAGSCSWWILLRIILAACRVRGFMSFILMAQPSHIRMSVVLLDTGFTQSVVYLFRVFSRLTCYRLTMLLNYLLLLRRWVPPPQLRLLSVPTLPMSMEGALAQPGGGKSVAGKMLTVLLCPILPCGTCLSLNLIDR